MWDVTLKKIPVRKMLGSAFLLLSFGFALIWLHLNTVYVNTLPTKPQPDVGRSHPLNVHGTVVYLTDDEQLWLFTFQYGAPVIAILAGLLLRSKKD